MDSRIAMIGIIIEDTNSAEKVNSILHECNKYIVGRMGIPYPKRSISLISVLIDAPMNIISSISGKLGMIPNVNTKVMYYKSK